MSNHKAGTNDGIVIRKAMPGDVEVLTFFRVGMLSEVFTGMEVSENLELKTVIRKYFEDKLEGSDFFGLIAEKDGREVGTGGMTISIGPPSPATKSGKKAYIFGMYAIPKERCHGIGSRIFQCLVDEAETRGIEYIHLHAAPDGLNVYLKKGFHDPHNKELVLLLKGSSRQKPEQKQPENKFVVILKEKKTGTLQRPLLESHVEHLKNLHLKNLLFLCGPLKDSESALLIIRAEKMEDVESIVRSDPFIINQYYRSFEIHELIEGNESNNWLLE
ncbi:MAG: GNAT family N-acetyltransferase [Candidatus Wallbacteria bacterium]|nr:GNAT family N-acetyltransferase [Candidatus Wallbacteria bacterium]